MGLSYLHRGIRSFVYFSFLAPPEMIGLKGTLNVWQNVPVNASKTDYFLFSA